MTARPWLVWGKRALIGVSIAAIVMTAISDDGSGAVQTARTGKPPPVKTAAPQQGTPKLVHVELERLNRTAPQREGEAEAEIGNAFRATSWYVPPPPPPPPPPLPPPKPAAPPMPFTYLGLYEEGSGKVIMLVKGDRVYTVTEGDVIENTYRVERVTTEMVELTYLPLNIRQSIRTGAAS